MIDATLVIAFPASKLTKNQKRLFKTEWLDNGKRYTLTATVRHDDEYGNGHNSFSITANIGENWREYMGGCCHDEIAKHLPDLAPYIKWHGCATDQPLHYVANALYWAGHNGWRDGKPNSPPNLGYLESTVVWGALDGEQPGQLVDYLYSDERGFTWNEAQSEKLKVILLQRLPALMLEFKTAIESLGMIY